MEKDLRRHIAYVENALSGKSGNTDWQALGEYSRTQIGYFQNERRVHLFIMFFFAFMFFVSVIAVLFVQYLTDVTILYSLTIVCAILLIMLCFYVRHYFVLENGVQKLYRLDAEITKKGKLSA